MYLQADVSYYKSSILEMVEVGKEIECKLLEIFFSFLFLFLLGRSEMGTHYCLLKIYTSIPIKHIIFYKNVLKSHLRLFV